MIRAEAYSDDYRVEVHFDATRWFEQASDQDILALAKIDWGGNYASDGIALFETAHNSKVADLFEYISVVNNHTTGDGIGFECHVVRENALAWIRDHRPHLVAQIEQIETGEG